MTVPVPVNSFHFCFVVGCLAHIKNGISNEIKDIGPQCLLNVYSCVSVFKCIHIQTNTQKMVEQAPHSNGNKVIRPKNNKQFYNRKIEKNEQH